MFSQLSSNPKIKAVAMGCKHLEIKLCKTETVA